MTREAMKDISHNIAVIIGLALTVVLVFNHIFNAIERRNVEKFNDIYQEKAP